MQMSKIKLGDTVVILPRHKHQQRNPAHWHKATVLAVREPLDTTTYSISMRHYDPTGVRVRLHPPEEGRWGRYSNARRGLHASTTTIRGWQGQGRNVNLADLPTLRVELPDDEVIVPARMIGGPWDETDVDAYHARQDRHRRHREEREAQRKQAADHVQELLTALGSDLTVPEFATGMSFTFEELTPLLERAVQAVDLAKRLQTQRLADYHGAPMIPIEEAGKHGRPIQ